MPILKVEGRIWHLAKKIRDANAWSDNHDLQSFPEVIDRKEDQGGLPSYWVENDLLVLGYRPFSVLKFVMGLLVIVNAVSWIMLRLIGSGEARWFLAFAISLAVGVGLVYSGMFSRFRRFVVFDRNRGLVHFSRPVQGGYMSLRWEDAHFIKARWHFSRVWEPGKSNVDILYFLLPPFRSPSSSLLSYALRKQIMCFGAKPNAIWWFVVNFMCHGPAHQEDIAKLISDRKEECDACFNGDMKAMQYFVGTKIKVLSHGAGKFEWPFTYGKEWKHLDLSKLPKAATHVIGPDRKWKKLKKHELGDCVPGPAWESLTKGLAAAIFDGEAEGETKRNRNAS